MMVEESTEDVPDSDGGALFLSVGERIVFIVSWKKHAFEVKIGTSDF